MLPISGCNFLKADPNFIDIALNHAFIKMRLKGANINDDAYSKEESNCILTSNATVMATTGIEMIGVNYIEIKIAKPDDWMYSANRHQTFDVMCSMKKRRSNVTEEKSTRPFLTGGKDGNFIYGGGVRVVDTNGIRIRNVSVQMRDPPMKYDVSSYLRIDLWQHKVL